MTTTADQKTRTITLTGRRPVKIIEADWPTIAQGDGDSYGCWDPQGHDQALERGECDRYLMRVRQHQDGRVLVYAVCDAATGWTDTEDHRGGVLLDAGDDIAAAIREVGEDCGIPNTVIRECVADLPPETV